MHKQLKTLWCTHQSSNWRFIFSKSTPHNKITMFNIGGGNSKLQIKPDRLAGTVIRKSILFVISSFSFWFTFSPFTHKMCGSFSTNLHSGPRFQMFTESGPYNCQSPTKSCSFQMKWCWYKRPLDLLFLESALRLLLLWIGAINKVKLNCCLHSSPLGGLTVSQQP